MTALVTFTALPHTPFTKSIDGQAISTLHAATARSRAAWPLPSRSVSPALITGDVGTGKSTAVRAFAQTLDHNLYPVVYLSNPHLGVTALYREILLALQVEPAFGFMRLLPQLRSTLHDLARKGRYVLLIVDEAHLLLPRAL